MELEVKDNKFYVLVNKQEKGLRLYDALSPSVKKLKEFLRSGGSTEDIELMSIEMKGEKFEISTIPWSVIATELVKE